VLITTAPLLTWVVGFVGGRYSFAAAIVLTIIAVGAIVGGFVWLVRSRCTRLPPQSPM